MWKRARMASASASLALAAVIVAGCGGGTVTDGQATPTGDGGPIPEGLDRFYTQSLTWGSCEDYETDGPLSGDMECAHVQVPLNYSEPDGATAQIAISRVQAAKQSLGSLLVNPGGPGASGLAMASIAENTGIGDRFDVVGFDPRGVGASTPQIRCLTDKEIDEDRARNDVDRTPEGIANAEADNQHFADTCAERVGVDVLAHVGTYEVVRDMDVIRAVLGDEKLNFLGYSYGSRLGTIYAETFPTNIRAMVLDGALDPQQDPVEEVIAQAEAFQLAFDAFVADCTSLPDCPLGSDPAQAVDRFRDLVDPLIDTPAETTDPRGLGYRDAITGVQQALYSQQLWGVLRGGLTSLTNGTGDSLLMLADIYEGRNEEGKYTNIGDAFIAIRCVDDPPVDDPAIAGEAEMRYREVAPFLDDGRGTGQAPRDVCAFWPVPPTGEPHEVSAPGVPPIVVVSTTEDPATPYQAGVDLAAGLGGTLVTYRGNQHTVVLDGNSCVDDAITAYFVDLTAPEPGLTC
ncbi:MAG: alpha/beta hydrolase [Rhodococcus sp.]|nr:alpha/beta hydrolase [Rhodococcus sp. (in: high G+C Gram-positive bacteria)]